MSILYQMHTEADFDATTKFTGTGQAQAWDGAVLPYGAGKWTIANTNTFHIQATYSPSTAIHRLGFYLNLSGLTMGSGEVFNIIHVRSSSVHTDRLYEVRAYNHPTNGLSVGLLSYAESAGSANATYVTAVADVQWYEIQFTRSSGVGQADASVTMWTGANLTQIISRTGLINYTSFGLVDKINIGGVEGLDAGTSGVLTVGNVVITDTGAAIGPYSPYNQQAFNQLRRRRRLSS